MKSITSISFSRTEKKNIFSNEIWVMEFFNVSQRMKLQLLGILQGAFMVEQECNQTLFKAKRPVLMSQGPKYFCGKMNSTPFWKRNALVFVFFPNIKKR